MKYLYIYTAIIIVVFSSCRKENEEETTNCFDNKNISKVYTTRNSNENLNISFLLDLSDRINPEKFPNPAMEYYQRDAKYIQSAAEAFNVHLRTKKVIRTNDKIQLFFDPEPKTKEISDISNKLKFQVDKTTVTNDLLCSIDSVYATLPVEIYNQAITDNDYIGSNTWGFFKNKVKDYCIEDQFRNILIILTDGYIYHKDIKRQEGNLTSYLIPQYIRSKRLNTEGWKSKIEDKSFGFIPAANNLSNLEVLILGLHPNKDNPYEEDVIRLYWNNWLTSMNVKRFAIKNADLPSNMDKIIKDFILLTK
ncbi:hypothetical protein [uncultured Aquimarina sp.]|uniref:hypothetical protein n=1 Tax=uncultured Aquimarina sp. TaxID=575652 RepID=UPI002633317A|nr:hypothetical protein [uncultured Aquimarina sp.]